MKFCLQGEGVKKGRKSACSINAWPLYWLKTKSFSKCATIFWLKFSYLYCMLGNTVHKRTPLNSLKGFKGGGERVKMWMSLIMHRLCTSAIRTIEHTCTVTPGWKMTDMPTLTAQWSFWSGWREWRSRSACSLKLKLGWQSTGIITNAFPPVFHIKQFPSDSRAWDTISTQ